MDLKGATMYKKDRNRQFTLEDFNQPIGLKMDPENRWVKKADLIPWNEIEERYAKLFPSHTGMPAKPLRVALGSLIIQKRYNYSDRELVRQITENPYYQYFIGLSGYQQEQAYAPSLLVQFRKHLTDEILEEINEMIINYNLCEKTEHENDDSSKDDKDDDDSQNGGTLILDATCAPQNISYPQDINLLNEAREKLEKMFDTLHHQYKTINVKKERKPRTRREIAGKNYLEFAKLKKRSSKARQIAIKRQLNYVRRDLKLVETFLEKGMCLSDKDIARLQVIKKLYEQQRYMYENKTHTVSDRIVSISQPYIRPIVRGKAKNPTEFGVKLDLSIDEQGMARLERLSFDAYNESDVLIGAVENYRVRTGHYPSRILVDKIYRNRKNLAYCKERGIRISGPALGRPKKDQVVDKKQEYQDSVDRIEVERRFSLAKSCFGLGLIKTKLDVTTRSSIALSILAMNVERLATFSFVKFFVSIFQAKKSQFFSFLRFNFSSKLKRILSIPC